MEKDGLKEAEGGGFVGKCVGSGVSLGNFKFLFFSFSCE